MTRVEKNVFARMDSESQEGRYSSGSKVRNAYPLAFQAAWSSGGKMNHEWVWERFRCYCMRTASRLGISGGKSNRAKGGGARFPGGRTNYSAGDYRDRRYGSKPF